MFGLLLSVLAGQELALEKVALRQQLAVLRRHRPLPSLRVVARLFWMAFGELVAAMAGGAVPREARDGHRLAPGRFPTLLAMALAQRRATAYRCRHSSARSEDGHRQPLIGQTEDSR